MTQQNPVNSKAFSIGPYDVENALILAPMAGVTDLPFRRLCRSLGAGMVVSEMVTSDVRLWHTNKSKHRLIHDMEIFPRSVQIAGGDPLMMQEAAQHNVALGAQIIDINMGCPAKKVCNKAAGSALMKDEPLVRSILESVVSSVSVPVTLKIRTGWDTEHKNGLAIAKMAQEIGIQAIAVHGRTRECRFNGHAEYDTIAEIKQVLSIPVFANGDITDAKTAKHVKDYTQVDGIMIGRAAQGKPWIFREIDHFLSTGLMLAEPSIKEIAQLVTEHVTALHEFYGQFTGVRIARKHVGWYLKTLLDESAFRKHFNQINDPTEQIDHLQQFFTRLESGETYH